MTMRFEVDSSFWVLFPEARIGAIVVQGIDNQRDAAACEALMLDAACRGAELVGDAEIGSLPQIAPWREAYRSFGVRPSKFKSSIESLLRAARAESLGSINPLVDLYNAVSLEFFLPCGSEDLGQVRGNIRLIRATGDESFVPLGSIEEQPPSPGEVIYRDDLGVICRCWNWREADRTKLTPSTTRAFLCLEALPPTPAGHLRAACDRLASLVTTHLGGTATVALLDHNNPAQEFDAG